MANDVAWGVAPWGLPVVLEVAEPPPEAASVEPHLMFQERMIA